MNWNSMLYLHVHVATVLVMYLCRDFKFREMENAFGQS